MMILSKVFTFKKKLILFISLLFSLIAVIQLVIIGYYIRDILVDKSMVYFKEILSQVSIRVDTEIEARNQLMSQISANPSIAYYINDIINEKKSYRAIASQISSEVLRLKPGEFGSISDVYIFPIKGEPVNCYYSQALSEIDPYTKLIMERYRQKPTREVIWSDFYHEQGYISSYSPITEGKNVVGVLRIKHQKKIFGNIVDNIQMGNDNLIFITDEMGNIIYPNEGTSISRSQNLFWPGENYIIKTALANNGWSIVGVIPHEVVSSQINRLLFIFIALYIITFGFVLTAVIAYSGKVLKPLNNIVKGMKEIQNGNLNITIAPTSSDEFGFITENFNFMVESIKSLLTQIHNHQKTARKAEMIALETKLNPHFIYNTLDTIYLMLLVKENFDEADMVIKLSDILRYSISHMDDFVTVEEDIKQIESYIALQQYRYDNKLTYKISLDSDTLHVRIPKLFLQPLVENSLKHGFKDMKYDGYLEIYGRRDGNDIVFVVKDNGAGISPEQLESVCEHGIGLRITRDRIRFAYGENYGMNVYSSLENGTKIVIKIGLQPNINLE